MSIVYPPYGVVGLREPELAPATTCGITFRVPINYRAVGFTAMCPRCGAGFEGMEQWAASVCRKAAA